MPRRLESTLGSGGDGGAGSADRRARRTETNMGRAEDTLPTEAKCVAKLVAA